MEVGLWRPQQDQFQQHGISQTIGKRRHTTDVSDRIPAEGATAAARMDLNLWMKTLPQPWTAAMEATIFRAGSTIIFFLTPLR